MQSQPPINPAYAQTVLEGLTIPILKAELKAQGLKVTGTKAELIQRIRTMPNPARTERIREALAAAANATIQWAAQNPLQPQQQPNPIPQLQLQTEPQTMVDPLDGLSVPMLKDELKQQGLAASGTKAELIQRIRAMHQPAITRPVQEALAKPLIPQAEMGRWVVRGGQIQNLPPGQILPPVRVEALPPIPVEMKRDPLDKLTIAQLKAELRQHPGMVIGGTKSELVQRVRAMPEPAVTPEVQAALALH